VGDSSYSVINIVLHFQTLHCIYSSIDGPWNNNYTLVFIVQYSM